MSVPVDEKRPSKINLNTSEFVTAISHYYRAEMTRANVWRSRLDVTTNWAIITTAAFLSVGFGSDKIPHFVIILATIFVLFFLIIEARRYKYYDLWRWRIALLNENFYAVIISPNFKPLHENWRELLSEELQHSAFKIKFMEAFGRRLRRNYSWIFVVLAICWFTKISIHPVPVQNIADIIDRASIFRIIPGWIVLLGGMIFNSIMILIAIITAAEREEVVKIYPADQRRF